LMGRIRRLTGLSRVGMVCFPIIERITCTLR